MTLRRPHLVLTYIRENNIVARQAAKKHIEKANRRLRQTAWIQSGSLGAAGESAPFAEVGTRVTPQFRLKRGNRIGQVSNDRQIAGTHAIELRRINFKVNNL